MKPKDIKLYDNKKLYEELRLKQTEMNSLLQVTQAINDNLGINGLIKIYTDILIYEMGAERVAFFLEDDNWRCQRGVGVDDAFVKTNHQKELLSFTHLTHLNKEKHSFSPLFDIIIPVYHKNQPLAFTLIGGTDQMKEFSLEERLNFIQTISSIISVAIENKKLFKDQLKQQEVKKEMELAGKMQTTLIPEKLPSDDRMEMAGIYMPHFDVGGDYYDAFELNEDELFFCIGDISGKGMAAALLMASFQSGLRSLVKHQQGSLIDMVQELNTKVSEITRGEKFITMFMAKYNFITHTLQYVNAGHPPPVLCSNGNIQLLGEGCTILGMFDKLPLVNSGKISLTEDSLLVTYTDGLTELENKRQEELGVERLVEFVKAHEQDEPKHLLNELTDYLVSFKGKKMFSDDISILVCRFFAKKRG